MLLRFMLDSIWRSYVY